ncbi:related to Phosphopantothenoylcysteine decarboxylase [Pseudozyma flocculosa]|nr:related to Phosphopantothenoylcysteine decarboxylase [Pseudozyma flocculosa]
MSPTIPSSSLPGDEQPDHRSSPVPLSSPAAHPLDIDPQQEGGNLLRAASPNNLAVPTSPGLAHRDASQRDRATSHDGASFYPPRSTSPASSAPHADPIPSTNRDWSRATIGFSIDRRGDAPAITDAASSSKPNEQPGAPSQHLPSSKTYHSLSYAPRQRQSILRTNHPVFQSYSSQFNQAQVASPAASSTTLSHIQPSRAAPSLGSSTSPSFPSFIGRQAPTQSESKVSTARPQPSAGSAASMSAASAAELSLAKMQLAEMKEAARQLGLGEASAGWMIIEALQAASEGEWATIASLVASGEATMLLPKEPPSVFSSGSRLSLSFAHDHLIFDQASSSPSPSPSSLASAGPEEDAAPSFVTLSGLRGQLQPAATPELGQGQDPDAALASGIGERRPARAVLKSFVPRAGAVVQDLQDSQRRHEMLDSLAPLPVSIDATLDALATLAFPTFELSAYRADFPLPPPLQSRRSHARKRTQSSSRLNAAGSRASASFASLFGGSGREKKRGQEEATGSELLDAAQLSAPVPADSGDGASSPARPPSGGRSHSEGVLGAASESQQAKPDEMHTETAMPDSAPRSSSASDGGSVAATRPKRTISVWVVDRVIRRSSVLRAVGKVMAGRISERLRRAGLDEGIIEVVSSFSAMFVPPVVQTSGAHLPGAEGEQTSAWSALAASGASSSLRSPTGISPSTLASAPYLAGPDEMSENFQDFYASVRGQLEGAEQEKVDKARSASQGGSSSVAAAASASASLEEQQALMDRVDGLLEAVETAVTQEVYDRIFCPPTSRDDYHDDALASRIAALNVLGLSLTHLGLQLPEGGQRAGEGDGMDQQSAAGKQLDAIVAACGEELQKLQSPLCRSPQAKLEVLVSAHRIVVEGLSSVSGLRLKDEEEQAADLAGKATTSATETTRNADNGGEDDVALQKASGKTSSADLILPILIFSIVSANPPKLASNLFFIQRFRAENLVRGETAYCLVNVQAAVAFLENVDVKDLGLDASRVSAFEPIQRNDDPSSGRTDRSVPADKTAPKGALATAADYTRGSAMGGGGDRAAPTPAAAAAAGQLAPQAVALSIPHRLRGRLTQEIGDLAGISNKVITGVMGSSISAFGRVMGAGMAVTNETWERSRADGPKTLDEIRGALSGNRSQQPSGSSFDPAPAAGDEGDSRGVNAVGTGAADERQDDSDARSIRSAGSGRPRRGTGPSAGTEAALLSSSFDGAREKPSIGDRLASLPMLGRFGTGSGTPTNQTFGGALLASPGSISRELPGPPPPLKQAPPTPSSASRPAHRRTGSYLASLGRSSSSRNEKAEVAVEEKIPASLQSPYARLSRPPTAERPVHVVLACTGSVASVKVPSIVEELMQYANVRVQVVPTASSLHFFDRNELQRINDAADGSGSRNTNFGGGSEAGASRQVAHRTYTVRDLAAENLAAVRSRNHGGGGGAGGGAAVPADADADLYTPRVHLWTDEDEWRDWKKLGDPVLHIELRRWADIVLVAPCSANTLAKLNGGICDSLLTSFLRALSSTTPTIVFPAMNTLMYLHPLTSRHLGFVKEVLGYEVVGPIEKRLACGDVGAGAMYEWLDIVQIVVDRFGLVVATAGGAGVPSGGAEGAVGAGGVKGLEMVASQVEADADANPDMVGSAAAPK